MGRRIIFRSSIPLPPLRLTTPPPRNLQACRLESLPQLHSWLPRSPKEKPDARRHTRSGKVVGRCPMSSKSGGSGTCSETGENLRRRHTWSARSSARATARSILLFDSATIGYWSKPEQPGWRRSQTPRTRPLRLYLCPQRRPVSMSSGCGAHNSRELRRPNQLRVVW